MIRHTSCSCGVRRICLLIADRNKKDFFDFASYNTAETKGRRCITYFRKGAQGMISQQQIDEIIEKNDIGEVIGEYVKLERKGSGYSGLCPFHNEKTPSFSVHEGKQIFKCFGCGKGGNVVNFIMLAENLNYPEALEFLAKRPGFVWSALSAGSRKRGAGSGTTFIPLTALRQDFFTRR